MENNQTTTQNTEHNDTIPTVTDQTAQNLKTPEESPLDKVKTTTEKRDIRELDR